MLRRSFSSSSPALGPHPLPLLQRGPLLPCAPAPYPHTVPTAAAPRRRRQSSSLASSHMPHLQAVTSEFLSAEELPAGTHLHLIVLNYVLPQQTAQLWHRGGQGLGVGLLLGAVVCARQSVANSMLVWSVPAAI